MNLLMYKVSVCIICRFEPCWAALMKDTNGVILVYNPDEANHDKELDMW